jgi:hypothetical protein
MDQNSKKGQYFSFDAIMATLVFLLAVSLLSNYWFGVRAAAEKGDDTYKEALRISDSLLGEGVPQNWHTGSTAYSFGLAKTNATAELDKAKILRFISLLASNYTGVREGLRTAEHIHISIEELSATPPIPLYSGGRIPNAATTAVTVSRISTMTNGAVLKPVKLTLVLWNDRR